MSTKSSWTNFFANLLPHTISDAFGRLISEYYTLLARDQGKPSIKFFAEKNNNLDQETRDFTRRVFGKIKEIVLLRDPRDVLVSRLKYFKGAEATKSFSEMSHSCNRLFMLHRDAGPETMFVKYESMVLNGTETFAGVSDFLGARVPTLGDARREAAAFQEHATSSSPADSIGRWKQGLDQDQIRRADDHWGKFLETFGYERAL